MRPRMPAVREDGGVLASGLFEGVGQGRQALERTLVIDRLSELDQRAVVRRSPQRSGRRSEGVAENIAKENRLRSFLGRSDLPEGGRRGKQFIGKYGVTNGGGGF